MLLACDPERQGACRRAQPQGEGQGAVLFRRLPFGIRDDRCLLVQVAELALISAPLCVRSRGGAFFGRAVPYPVGTEAEVSFELPSDDRMITCRGEVVSVAGRSSFSDTSSPIRLKLAPHLQAFPSSPRSWMTSTRGSASGKGLLPPFTRL